MTAAVERPDGPSRDPSSSHDTTNQSISTTMTNQSISTTSIPASLISSDMLNGQGPTMGQGVVKTHGEHAPNLADGEAKCGGCSEVIDQEHGGTVVAFGSSLWHVDCFRCAKCKERVSADTNLLLLSDGSPVCGNCSYQCFVCKQAITEEAIMTGDESYHAHCFTCRTCKRRIEELVFAKTSQGIYCMACHNERVARSRRHAEAKRQRAARKEKEAKERGQHPKEGSNLSETPVSSQFSAASAPNLAPQTLSPAISPATTPTNASYQFTNAASPNYSERGEQPTTADPNRPSRERDLSLDGRLPRSISPIPKVAEPPPPLAIPSSPSEPSYTRAKAGDPSSSPRLRTASSPQIVASQSLGSTAPLNLGNKSPNANAGLGVGPVGLSVPTSRAEKRRSINPAMSFNMDAANGTFAVEPRLSPLPPSPLRTSFSDLQADQHGGKGTTSSSPTVATTAFPFPHPAPAPTSMSHTRIDSEPDSLDQHDSQQPAQSQVQTTTHGRTSEDNENTPRLIAPDLPAMSFSLSDPDFASILKEMDKTSPKDVSTNAGSMPKTSVSQSSFITKSPQMDQLASAAGDDTSASTPTHGGLPKSLSSSRLGPPHSLRTRQPSTESTNSVGPRFSSESALYTLVELVASAKHANNDKVQVDLMLLANIVSETEDLRDQISGLRSKYSGAKRTSQQYSEGLTVAGEEYDKEVAMRHELEAEVTRLKAQVHTQTARLSVISGDERRQESMKRRSQDLASSLSGLERDISRLRAQRDMTIAEVEELHARRTSTETELSSGDAASIVGQSLTTRLDTIKEQYREELEPLTAQREALQREIAELRETRELCLEESTALTAKNEELAELNAQLTRQNESLQDSVARGRAPTIFSKRTHPSGSPSMSSLATSGTLHEVPEETARVVKVSKPEPIEAAPARRFKWGIKSSKGPDMSGVSASISRPLGLPTGGGGGSGGGGGGGGRNVQRPSTEFGLREHSFQQYSTMRLTRCELCQEKMWGLQEVRCSSCGTICHSKCAEKLPRSCTGTKNGNIILEEPPAGPSMFGKDLSEQVATDDVAVPVIITKCIYAVEAVGMEYEGIYRKSGGSSQSKQITQLFEKGDYDSFDLADVETFNDISSVTSVLKNYFRQLPNPLLTHALHESFVTAACIPNAQNKNAAMRFAIEKLPKDHYNTLRTLMLHLHRVTQHASVNLMTSQNLGVVFGPTLMRSADPGREFGDMAGKALSIQWMVENAPSVFAEAL